MDTYETFQWSSPNIKVPKHIFYAKYLSNYIDTSMILKSSSNSDSIVLDTAKLEVKLFNDSLGNCQEICQNVILAQKRLIGLHFAGQINGIKANDTIPDYLKQYRIKNKVMELNDSLGNFDNIYLKDTTLIAYIKYSKKSWDDMEKETYHHEKLDVRWELKWIHGIIPVIIAFLCFILSLIILHIVVIQNNDFKKIQSIYLNLNKEPKEIKYIIWPYRIIYIIAILLFIIFFLTIIHFI
jgi:hypothetical protein